MEIYEFINNSPKAGYKAFNLKNHVIPLTYGEYPGVYRELELKNTCYFVDNKGILNLLFKVKDGLDIKNILRGPKKIDLKCDEEGPVIFVNIENGKRITFPLSFNAPFGPGGIGALLSEKRFNIHTVVSDECGITSINNASVQMEDRDMERLRYIVEYCYYGCRPRIEYELEDNNDGMYIEMDYSLGAMEELLDIADEHLKSCLEDVFNVYIENKEHMKFIFSGNPMSFETVKKKMAEKYSIQNHGKCIISGKPFFRYSRGYIYFFKYDD